jgi:hypothetical protein
MTSGSSPTVGFTSDIMPLFTQVDIDHMQQQGVELSDYAYMSDPTNADAVYQQVSTGAMPPSWGGGAGPWSEDKVQLFKQWMDGGYQR